MAAPVLANRSACFVNKTGTDDAGYNAVGKPEARLTIAAALADLAANYPAASATNPHIVSVGPGVYTTPAFALPPFTYIVGDPDGMDDPTRVTVISLTGNITLAAGWSPNATQFGGFCNLTIEQSSSQTIDLTMPAPAAGTPARTIELRGVRMNVDAFQYIGNTTGDAIEVTDCAHTGNNGDAVSFRAGTVTINGLQSAAPVAINATTVATVAQAYGVFITNASSGLTCATTGAANCTVRLGACDLRALTLNETAAGVVTVSADAISIPLAASLTFSGTATDADLVRTTDGGGISPVFPGSIDIAASGYYGWTGRSRMRSGVDGAINVTNNAGNAYDLFILGLATSAFPALQRAGTAISVRLADNSAYAPLNASALTVDANAYLQFTASSVLRAPSDGLFRLSNAAENDFGRLLFGGTSAAFAAIRRAGTGLDAVTADGSAYSLIQASGFRPMTTTGIVGTGTNDNAAAGSVGEYISSVIASGSAVALSTGTAANITSISLTAGDWDISGVAYFDHANTTTIVAMIASISQTSATLSPNNDGSRVQLPGFGLAPGNTLDTALAIPRYRVSLSATTTIYFVANSTFGVDTMAVYGGIFARRVR